MVRPSTRNWRDSKLPTTQIISSASITMCVRNGPPTHGPYLRENLSSQAFTNSANGLPALTAYPALNLSLSPDGGSLWKPAEEITKLQVSATSVPPASSSTVRPLPVSPRGGVSSSYSAAVCSPAIQSAPITCRIMPTTSPSAATATSAASRMSFASPARLAMASTPKFTTPPTASATSSAAYWRRSISRKRNSRSSYARTATRKHRARVI